MQGALVVNYPCDGSLVPDMFFSQVFLWFFHMKDFGDLEMTPIEPASASSKHCQGIHKCQIWGLPTNFWLQENLMKVNCPRLLFQSSC
ncbi:hypothetical protein CY35_13G021100 [Sphagnum magellanicum]|nr:hypothetical protein CY35_13G021100 [Sphagnum magellanicum]